jgi:hypothetical protein
MMIESGYLVVCLALPGPFGRRFESFPWKPLLIRRIDGSDGRSEVLQKLIKELEGM